jgi:glycosyltransferase involved in cell wall biosynthesis
VDRADAIMTCSVALCTYNGAAYLVDQLESIAAQSRPPDELVVCDDASGDDTVAMVRAFAARARFPVRLTANTDRLGSTRNFERAIAACTGDFIALSDQDDVWHPDKLRVIENRFLLAPGVGLVFSDADVADDALRPRGPRLWARIGLDESQRRLIASGRALDVLVQGWTVTGATMAFRSRFRSLCLPVPTDVSPMIHDGWIALVVAAVAEIDLIDEPLITYRQHSAQQLGAPPPKAPASAPGGLAALRRVTSFAAPIATLRALGERLSAHAHAFDVDTASRTIDRMLRHYEGRASLPRRRVQRLPVIVRELTTGRYHRYGSGLRSAVKDLVS